MLINNLITAAIYGPLWRKPNCKGDMDETLWNFILVHIILVVNATDYTPPLRVPHLWCDKRSEMGDLLWDDDDEKYDDMPLE